jgi:UDP-N-acetylmuramate dehydrogenase
MNTLQQLEEIVGSKAKEGEPMRKHTNFRIGGPAKWFVEARSVEELQSVLEVAKQNNINTFVFGGGSNILVHDDGFDGIVIKIAMRAYDIIGTKVKAQAGVLVAGLARATAVHGLKGLTWGITLPGTVGGGVRGNAGCFGGEIKDHLVSVEVLRDGKVIVLTKDELKFGYRDSSVKHSDDIVLTASFELEEGDSTELKAQLDDNIMKRKTTQPMNAGSAGCLFKNYNIQDDEELQRISEKLDIPAEMRSGRRISAGWLIDKMDLKGTSVGDAMISDEHANFLVNKGSATADQIAQLIAIIKTKVRDEYGILLEEEVQYLGF